MKYLITILLFLPTVLFAQLPTIDEPQDSDAHFTPSRGVPSTTRNDTLRTYMAPKNLGTIALSPGSDFLPDSLRGNFFYSSSDSKWYFVAYDRTYIDVTSGGGGSGTVESVVAGTGISVDDTDPANPIVTNSSPDQVVSLNEGSNVTVSGTYPNFTITVPSLDDGDDDPTNELYDDAELRDSLAQHRADIDALPTQADVDAAQAAAEAYADANDDDTQLNETQVDAFVANNGYLTSEVDGSTTNELQDLSVSSGNLNISSGTGVAISLLNYFTQSGSNLYYNNPVLVGATSFTSYGNGQDFEVSGSAFFNLDNAGPLSSTLTNYSAINFSSNNYSIFLEGNASPQSYGIGFGTGEASARLHGAIVRRNTGNNGFGEMAFYNKQGTGVSTAPTLKMLFADDGGIYFDGLNPDNLPTGISGNTGVWAQKFRAAVASSDAIFQMSNDQASWLMYNDRNSTSSLSLNGGALVFQDQTSGWSAMSFDPTAEVINLLGFNSLASYDGSGPDNVVVASGSRGELDVIPLSSLGGDGNGILEDAGPHNLNDGTVVRGATESGGSIGRWELGNAVSAGGTGFNYLRMYGNSSRGLNLQMQVNESTGDVTDASLSLSNPIDETEFTHDGDWTFTSAGSYRRGFDWTLNALLFSGADYILLPSSSPDQDNSRPVWNSDKTFEWRKEYYRSNGSIFLTGTSSYLSDAGIQNIPVSSSERYEFKLVVTYRSGNASHDVEWRMVLDSGGVVGAIVDGLEGPTINSGIAGPHTLGSETSQHQEVWTGFLTFSSSTNVDFQFRNSNGTGGAIGDVSIELKAR